MSPSKRNPVNRPYARSLDLPPPYRSVRLREVGDAFAHACANAAALGAGTLVSVGRFDLEEFAVVLEPDTPLASARLTFYAGMVALGDALAALGPPETPIAIEWPDAIYVDGGLVGGGRLGWPASTSEQATPDWLVFGAAIRTVSMSESEPGLHPLATALADEGFGDVGSGRLAEGFARHLMVALDRWQDGGLMPIAKAYLAKLKVKGGARRAIDAKGDLTVQRPDRPIEYRRLVPALKAPAWLDPKTGGPRL